MDSTFTQSSFAAGDLIVSSEPWIWAFKWKEYGQVCALCCSEKPGLLVCSACKVHRYCSPTCQVADWKKGHRTECAVIKDVCAQFAQESHDCKEFRCYCASTVIVAKLSQKLTVKKAVEIPGLGKKSALEVLNQLPNDWSLSPITMATGRDALSDHIHLVQYNIFPIFPPGDKRKRSLGAAIFPSIPYRRMTPVCWDTNVTMDFRARTLFVHASDDIANYTGLHDLRYNEFMTDEYAMPLNQRRADFPKFYGVACTCRKCTKEYEAEINPLKCASVDCMERIPSDERALDPCPQCGAINSERLEKFRYFVKVHDDMLKKSQQEKDPAVRNPKWTARRSALCSEMIAAGILHSDAHMIFACGWDLAFCSMKLEEYDAGWKLMREIVVCIRKTFPRYNGTRASGLHYAAKTLILAVKKCLQNPSRVKLCYNSTRILCMLNEGVPLALEWYQEARHIYATLLGEEVDLVKHLDALMTEVVGHLTGIGERRIA